MTHTISTRLLKLEARFEQRPGCAVCEPWDRCPIALCDTEDVCTRPETCPGCGRRVPIVEKRVIGGISMEAI